MGFFDDMRTCIFGATPCEPSFRVMLFGDCAGYFESVKTIKSFSPEEVVLGIKGGGLKVTGTGLYIKKFCSGDVVVCGKIKSVEKL